MSKLLNRNTSVFKYIIIYFVYSCIQKLVMIRLPHVLALTVPDEYILFALKAIGAIFYNVSIVACYPIFAALRSLVPSQVLVLGWTRICNFLCFDLLTLWAKFLTFILSYWLIWSACPPFWPANVCKSWPVFWGIIPFLFFTRNVKGRWRQITIVPRP